MICNFSNILVHLVFCQLNFIVLFPFLIKYCHILFIIIVFWLGCDRPSRLLFFRARFAFFHTHASHLTSFVCLFILFHSCCSHAQVIGKTLVHEFPISYSHTEWYLHFFALWRQWIIGNWARLNKSYYYYLGWGWTSRKISKMFSSNGANSKQVYTKLFYITKMF